MTTISLHSRLLLATLFPTTFLMVIFCIFVVLFRFEDINNLQNETADILLSKYSYNLTRTPEAQWQEVLEQALSEKNLHSIDIYGSSGIKLVHAGLPSTLNQLPNELVKHLKAQKNPVVYPYRDIFLIPINAPYLDQTNPKWLAIELQSNNFTLARYESVMTISITLFGFVVILLLWVSGNIRYWLNPIQKLIEQIRQINPQQLDKHLDTGATGDLYLLQESINHLLVAVGQEYDELKNLMEQAKHDLDENLITMESRNIELHIAHNHALEGNRAKSAFLANISHELRTPLNSINGFTKLLLKMPLDYKQRDWVESIQKSSEHLLAIIGDVLDFSKIEAGQLSLDKQPIILENIIFEVMDSLAPQAASNGLEQIVFIYEGVPNKVISDSLRLKQVLTNLVNNAIKFVKKNEKGEVIVRVMLEETRGNYHLIRIEVSDKGIGLSKDAKRSLFQAFQQGNPSITREFGGTGLGLAISRNIIKLMDGDIGFNPEQTQGATFWFNFRAGFCADTDNTPVIHLDNKQIIALESHEKNSQLLRATLSNAGAMITLTKTWPDLIEQLQDTHQVIIFDHHDLDKDKAYEQLKQLRKHFSGLLVMFSHLSDVTKLPDNAYAELHIYTLSKPIRPRHLLSLLAQGLLTARLTQIPVNTTNNTTNSVKIDLHILTVDDHPLNLKLVSTLLEDLGITVSCAASGMEAIELCSQSKFDLIFMDIQMPQISGLEATQRIRRSEDSLNRNTPIIALTAHALADEKDNMLKAGMNDYLTKPIDEAQLSYVIEQWTNTHLQPKPQATISSVLEKSTVNLISIDWSESLRLSANKSDLAYEMITMLISGLDTAHEKLNKSHQEQNYPALLSHVHHLYGATRYCGVPKLRFLLEQLERLLKDALKRHLEHDLAIQQQRDILLNDIYNEIKQLCTTDINQLINGG
ncbi:MAG TPA: response regulator [Agitococcus sp.]|nr:response regulator [Agitococcus sp.]